MVFVIVVADGVGLQGRGAASPSPEEGEHPTGLATFAMA